MSDHDPKPHVGTLPAGGDGSGGGGVSVTPSGGSSGFHINLIFDSSVSSAPAGFVTQITEAAEFLDSEFTNNITVNIEVGWGEIYNEPNSIPKGAAEALGGPADIYGVTYSQLKSYLTADATSATQETAIANMPATDPLGDPSAQDWWISDAQAKAFGLISPTGSELDGAIGFGTGWTSDWYAAALHELTHALGRIGALNDGYHTVLDLYRYSAPGVFQWHGGSKAYFSINGGVTDLANFGTTSDYSDWNNDSLAPNDPFDQIVTPSAAWTTVDATVMNVLGFDLASSPPPPPSLPDLVANTFAFNGQTASWQVANIGSGSAGATTAGIYLSADKTVTTSDTLVGTYSTPSLAPNAADSESLALNLPHDLAQGVYYLGVIANETGSVTESNTGNNVSNVVPVLLGNDDNNTLKGTNAVHILIGFGGDDIYQAGPGSDEMVGGSGTNRAEFSGAFANYSVSASGGGYTVVGSSGTDTLTNIEILQFSDRQMVLGSTGETLTARSGHDTLVGGAGNDTLIASPGQDTLTGGGGDDTFVFSSLKDVKVSAPDTITDFVAGQDVIDISALNANLPGEEPFHLGATPGHVGDITISYDSVHDRTVIDLFTNGDNKPDGVIWLSGDVTGLTASDFIL